jgi:transposase InsO family protein
MPWKASNLMDERIRFIGRVLDGEKISRLCEEFGISQKTGYKIHERYKSCGIEGLSDRSRRAYKQANRLPFQIERSILALKKEYPSWGAPKLREKLIQRYPNVTAPAISTVHAVLDRNGLVERRKRRRYKAEGTTLNQAHQPNGLWCADYKGEFMLGNKRYCYPLTITDYHSRYLLACEGLETTKEPFAFSVFERVFKDYGLPGAIRTDNGLPFSSPVALFGLSKLSVWWLRLGIGIERIKPGHPEQNGRHERMHLTMKKEVCRPPGYNFLQQQEKLDVFQHIYNDERPHQAINMRCPAELYTPSHRQYTGLPEIDYPYADKTLMVTHCGRICMGRKKVNFSTVFAGQKVGITETEDKIWLVSFMNYDLGYFDLDACRVEPLPNPFNPETPPIR